MTDWVKNEFDKHRVARQTKDAGDYLINFSNYWLLLRKQVETDIAKINKLWERALGSRSVSVYDTDYGYKIARSGNPAFLCSVRNGGTTINLATTVFRDGVGKATENNAAVEWDGHGIILRDGRMRYVVPQEASRFILGPIVEVLTA